YETTGAIGELRVAPGGDFVAFIEHPFQTDASGEIAVVDRQGKKRSLSPGWLRVHGLAWSSSGKEIWFTATKTGYARALHAADLEGHERVVLKVPGNLMIHDVAPDGRILLAQDSVRREMRARRPDEAAERDLSWLDYSVPRDISRDGTRVLFHEPGDGG